MGLTDETFDGLFVVCIILKDRKCNAEIKLLRFYTFWKERSSINRDRLDFCMNWKHFGKLLLISEKAKFDQSLNFFFGDGSRLEKVTNNSNK